MTNEFHGEATKSLGNQYLRLEYLANAGPRIVRLFVNGSDHNVFAEAPEAKIPSKYGTCLMRGGHRLWHAPESYPRSYLPDNDQITVEEIDGGVSLAEPTEPASGIAKKMEVRLHADRPAVTVVHELRNDGIWPVELAPWALTQVPLGGVAILPQQVGRVEPSGLVPNRSLVLWHYVSWSDSRLQVYDDFVLVHAEAKMPPVKVGYMNRSGWTGYLRNGVLFLKRFEPKPSLPHVDLGCNVETYCSDGFMEAETLAPIEKLAPGQAAKHVETWEFYSGIDVPQTIEGVRSLAAKLGL